MEEFDVFKFFKIMWKYRKLLIIALAVSTVVTLIISLLLPKSYLGISTVIPPEVQMGGRLLGELSSISVFGGRRGITTETIIAILKSKKMATLTVNNFNLVEVYRAKSIEIATRIFLSNLDVVPVEEEGVIRISFLAPSRTLAADITNFLVFNIDKINEELKLTEKKPLVKVLDIAVPPLKKEKPKTTLNILAADFLVLFFSIIYIIIKEKLLNEI